MTGIELSHADVKDIKSQSAENFRNIKPEKEMTAKELKEEVKEEANKAAGDVGEGIANNTEKDIEPVEEKPRYIITRNEILENDQHPVSGVGFERRVIELPNGERVEGVFPRFESLFDAKIPEDMYLRSDKTQFKECNRQLAQEIDTNPELRAKFSKEQIEQIYDGVNDGTAPDGYVWHHDAEAGKLQLVDFETHTNTGHTGGRSIWGGGSDNR